MKSEAKRNTPVAIDGHRDNVYRWSPDDSTVVSKPRNAVGPATASIVQIYGPDLGKRYPLTARTVIGRDPSAAVSVDLPGVSRRHAHFYERNGSWYVADLGSTNGTYRSGMEICGEVQLKSGDVLNIGGAVFKYLAGGDIESLYHEEIYRLTITDGLTGIANKRRFNELFEREVARARRRGRSLWIVMLDIDHFKKFNDVFGHVAGDHILQQLAELLESQVRAEEFAARFGGEEFVFMLPEAEHSEIDWFCERIRFLVQATEFLFDDDLHRITVSMGASSLRPGQSIDDLIRAADNQLYRAKRGGRNLACVEEPAHIDA